MKLTKNNTKSVWIDKNINIIKSEVLAKFQRVFSENNKLKNEVVKADLNYKNHLRMIINWTADIALKITSWKGIHIPIRTTINNWRDLYVESISIVKTNWTPTVLLNVEWQQILDFDAVKYFSLKDSEFIKRKIKETVELMIKWLKASQV